MASVPSHQPAAAVRLRHDGVPEAAESGVRDCGGCRRLLFHSQTVDFHGGRRLDKDQARWMLLAEEACEDGRSLETCGDFARRSPRVDIELWLRTG